ncbi:serine aminopeptidase domain-containing protein [Caballeronia insecticola]|uniref:Serine aminopeptidase S33 domain-containing protein n=1 Tax=Caballeronia insecticola TaxID=758793 RepID=R4WZP9_9BURK|nr:putative uncharacterized protein [Caballeronia insecticola]
MRFLADELSRRDVPALRFDYLATGDSSGTDHDGDRLDDFIADIGAAIERLQEETGVTNITLCGMRFGATLAALASQHPLVDSLALLAPILDGRRYRRELTALRSAWLDNLPVAVRPGQIDAPFHVLGQVYSKAFLDRLGEVDINSAMSVQPVLPKRVFVADTSARAINSLCVALRERGVKVKTDAFDDYLEFMQETASSTLPEKTLKRTAQWIAKGASESAFGESARRRTSMPARLRMRDDAIIETPEAIERPVVFGAAGLFGILCEPRDGLMGGPIVVIANMAASAHHGESRQSVRIARELAQRGIASLRMDARGIGDSPARSPDGTPDMTASLHAQTTIDDIASAAAWLKRKGYESIVAFGICSGAHNVLRAALREPAIAGVIAVNLQRFYIPEWMTLQELRNRGSNTMARLGPAILKPTKWWLVLSGKRGFKPIVRAFASNAAARLYSQIIGVRGRKTAVIGDKPITHPHAVVQTLEGKGVHAMLLYGGGDDGLDQLNAHFGRHGKKLSRLKGMTAEICEDLDHALYDPRALDKVIALCERFIRQLQPASASVADLMAAQDTSQKC